MLSIVIPSRNERFLDHTIKDVLKKATGNIEVFAVLDGYDTEEIKDDRLQYIRLPETKEPKKRHGINLSLSKAKGTHFMALDAHCMMAHGFDEILTRDCEDNMIMIPRRNRLDAEHWCIQKQSDNRPPIDYEYVMFPVQKDFKFPSFHGFKWDARTKKRWSIPIDDTMTMQASCWCMTADHYRRNNFMQVEGFGGWGQEAEELCFTTWLRGGRVVTNKRTWYAHLHKGAKYGRMYHLDRNLTRASYKFSFDFFFNNHLPSRKYDFTDLIERFMPIPGWTRDWEQRIRAHPWIHS